MAKLYAVIRVAYPNGRCQVCSELLSPKGKPSRYESRSQARERVVREKECDRFIGGQRRPKYLIAKVGGWRHRKFLVSLS